MQDVRPVLLAFTLLVLAPSTAGGSAASNGGTGSGVPQSTKVVRWSPFDSSGQIKKTLAVETVTAPGRCVGASSEVIGGLGYRCFFGHFVADPCWRDGPGQTSFIVCGGSPWGGSVTRVRVPHLMLESGITFSGHGPDGVCRRSSAGDEPSERPGSQRGCRR
jgi:hypothetical protein